jgi:drug/metabolite transporter (DMT)-like permease
VSGTTTTSRATSTSGAAAASGVAAEQHAGNHAGKRDAGVWLQLMLIAFLANGIGPFGLKVLTERGFGDAFQAQYLLYWYCGGLVFAVAALLKSRLRPTASEIGLGALMGACSLFGQAFTGLALSHGVPGHVAFPLTTGGSLFLVAAAGLLLFKERVGPYGIAGIVLGIVALVALSVA